MIIIMRYLHLFQMWNQGYISKSCKTTPHLVKPSKVHGERRDIHVTHVKHTEKPYNETTTDPFGISYNLY